MIKNILILLILCLSGLLGFMLSWQHHRQQVAETNAQVIETFHSPELFVKQITGDPRAGEKIFKEFCASCHAEKAWIDVPAPRINDKKRWQALENIGMPALLKITIDGVGAMPARGGCFECSDEQLKQAIEYILKSSKNIDKKIR